MNINRRYQLLTDLGAPSGRRSNVFSGGTWRDQAHVKISFDLDGTFYAAPAVFTALGIALQKDGHTVGILTGHGFRSEVSDRAKLLEFGFSPNFYYGRSDGEVSQDVLQWKASKLEAESIDVHVDDDADGIAKFTPRFMLKTKGGLPNLF